MNQKTIVLDENHFQLEELVGIAETNGRRSLPTHFKTRIHKARTLVDTWVKKGNAFMG